MRFLIGRAGTGKSAACAAAIGREMARDPLGPALLWITPQQATFNAERMLLTGAPVGRPHGSFRAQVLSFRRLALLIAQQRGLLGGQGQGAGPMAEMARLVLLQELLERRRDQLKIFSAVADRPGFVRKLDVTLRELRQHGQSPGALRELLDKPRIDAASARKLSDLALLLEAWERAIGGSAGWDFEAMMRQAAAEAGKASLIAGDGDGGGKAQVWVDAFSAFSALEIELLVALGRHAQSVTITVLADPESAALREMREVSGDAVEGGLFARTERMHRQLVDAFRSHHVAIEGTDFLRTAHRFNDRSIARVEAELWADGPRTPAPEGAAGSERSPGLEIWECSDPETEVRAVAQAIREMVTRPSPPTPPESPAGGLSAAPPLRYRQIGLIVPDLEGYADALRRIFAEHEIPHFIDQRRSIAHHPLVELLRSALAIISNRWDRDDVLLYLKTGLAGVNEEDVAEVENYLLAHGIDHLPWSAEWPWVAPNQKEDDEEEIPPNARAMLARVNQVRRKVWEDLRPWMEAAEAENPKSEIRNPESQIRNPASGGGVFQAGAEYVRGLRDLLGRLKVEAQINGWIAAARHGSTAADAELAQVHEQAWRQIQDLLAMLEELLTGRRRSLEEFAQLLDTALEKLTLGLIPPTVDQVLISSVTRSRAPEIKAGFVLGAVEGQFPKVMPEDPILSDAQRDFIRENSPFPVGDGADRQLLEMPFFDYIALTRASDRLVISFPLADRKGKALGQSRYIARLRGMFEAPAGAAPQIVERRFDAISRADIEQPGTIDQLGTVEDVLTGVAAWARRLIGRRRESLEGKALAEGELIPGAARRALYNWLVRAPGLRGARELVWPAIADAPPPQLAPALAERFFPPDRSLRLSASQLEKFADCPLQYFLHYTLGLRPRALLELDTLNLGSLYHRILERVYRRILDGRLPWPECDAAALREALETEVDGACEELHEELAERTPAYDQMRQRAKRTLGIAVEGQRRRAGAGDLQPMDVEVPFGWPGGPEERRKVTLPVLQIKTPGGHVVELNGKIDRIDASREGAGKEVCVIDYKSASEKKLDLYRVLHGLTLQLPLYAVVMRELAGYEPIAALYVPLGLSRKSVKNRRDRGVHESGDDAFYQDWPPRGLVDAQGAGHVDAAADSDTRGKSEWYEIGYNKDGGIPKRGDMLTHEDFAAVLDYVRWKVAAMTDDLMGGRIAPSPFRDGKQTPCEHCDFTGLCPFDRVGGSYRAIDKMKSEEAVAAMRLAREGGR